MVGSKNLACSHFGQKGRLLSIFRLPFWLKTAGLSFYSSSSIAVEDKVFGAGFMAGYKVLSKKQIIFETGLGIGHAFAGTRECDIILYFNLNVGYRFLEAKNRGKVR